MDDKDITQDKEDTEAGMADAPGKKPVAFVDQLIRRATQGAHDAVDAVASKLDSTVEGARDGVAKVTETPEEWMASAREAIRRHPFAAVGVALLVGAAVLGARSSRNR